MQIFVRALDSSTQVLAVSTSCSVEELRHAVEDRCRVPAEALGLVHGGRQLQDGCALSAYGVGSDSTVHVVLRLRGGKGGFGALLRGQGRDGKITTNFDACRDLSGRRLRQSNAEKKLQEWKAEAAERELEKVALQHIKSLAKAQRAEEERKVNVEQVVEEQRQAVARVQESVQSALAEAMASTSGSSKDAPAAAAGGKRKAEALAPAGAAAKGGDAGASGGKRFKMLPVFGAEPDSDASSSDDD